MLLIMIRMRARVRHDNRCFALLCSASAELGVSEGRRYIQWGHSQIIGILTDQAALLRGEDLGRVGRSTRSRSQRKRSSGLFAVHSQIVGIRTRLPCSARLCWRLDCSELSGKDSDDLTMALFAKRQLETPIALSLGARVRELQTLTTPRPRCLVSIIDSDGDPVWADD